LISWQTPYCQQPECCIRCDCSYFLNNQLLLWAQATQRGMTLTRVAAFGTWRKLGYRVRAGRKGCGSSAR
jgi:hypothetical protein